MEEMITNNPLALSYLLSDDIYQLNDQPAPTLTAGQTDGDHQQEMSSLFSSYEGGNGRSVLFLHSTSGSESLLPQDKEAFLKILAARGWTINDIALLNISGLSCKLRQLKDFFACNALVLLGGDPSLIGLKEVKQHATHEYEGLKLLCTYSFDEMHNNNDMKRVFWNEIKKL